MDKKRIYLFGNGTAEGSAKMKNLLGGKGAGLAEMARIGVPVPPGFTITTETCIEYYTLGKDKIKDLLTQGVKDSIKFIEDATGKKFGDKENPLLVSVRSGARVSMPGMMDTVLNLGINDDAVQGLALKTGNPRFAWDSYRRFIQMYGDVVMGVKAEKGEIDPFEAEIEAVKEKKGVEFDTELETEDLQELVERFKKVVKERTGREFPTDPWDQLWGAIMAVFDSWNNERAIAYRRIHEIPDNWGTAVNVVAMVFGNMGNHSATGVAFTRDAATGEKRFNGEYLINAQGEDVVAGIRTPLQITKADSIAWAKANGVSEEERKSKYPSLEEYMPDVYKELFEIQQKLENHYRDMQDIEFTIEEGRLWLLQTRTGKRTGSAMVKIALDMLDEGIIDEKEAVLRVDPNKLNELLHPVFDKDALSKAKVLTKGLPASPGAATGQVVFFADEAKEWADEGKKVILVRIETSPEDIEGMNAAQGILTSRGGMTSHAAVVARGMGKCAVVGAGDLEIDYEKREFKVGETTIKEGDWISLNGSTGDVYLGKIDTKDPEIGGYFGRLMELADKYRKLNVRTNAETPRDARVARNFGAEGIGLARTEHMFFEGERIKHMREMILADNEEKRREALEKLLPYQMSDFEAIFEVMEGLPVTVRLLDPPLHEFLPNEEEAQEEVAKELGVSVDTIKEKVEELKEINPMLGHRGCRLGNTYPEITEMQVRAILGAALNLKKKGIKAMPEIMVPLVGEAKELELQRSIIEKTAEKVFEEYGDKIDYMIGTMIEIPRAALTADEIAKYAEFFSFGTNDLTQMTYGYSRDDVGKFLPKYKELGILEHDPFQVLDQRGVGQLVEMGTKKGRSIKSNLKVGICGEHGGEPSSVEFCHRVGMNYVSCSPFRVPVARLAAAQANIKYGVEVEA
jgi:pyruvate,orthophosphate dikinase